jgi:acetyl-CoA synthetase
MNEAIEKLRERVTAVLALYSNPSGSAAQFLCDRHDPAAIAYTLVAPDLSSMDLSYGELRAESEKLAAAFVSLGLRPGDRIATLMGKTRAYLVAVMAIWRMGAVHVPLFTAFAPPAVSFRLLASGCKLVLCDAAQRTKLTPGALAVENPSWKIVTTGTKDSGTLSFDELLGGGTSHFRAAALGGNAPLIHIYTSGTTGTPKGVVVPLRALASVQIYADYALTLRPDDVFWNAADPGWAYGLYFGILATFVTGVRGLLVEGGFSVESTMRVLSEYGVTNFAAAPTVFRALRASGAKPKRTLKLRCASSAGEPLTPEIIEWSAEILRVPVHDHYGQTEAGMMINNHHHPALRQPLKAGSMGCAMPGWSAAILKPDAEVPAAPGATGRVAMDLARSPLAWFEGYANDPELSAGKFSADRRWYLTGDTGRLDDEGYFYFSARDDDVIIMAGYRIGPAEVESVLGAHSAVLESAVVAVPDAVRGEVLEAAVVLRAGHAPSDELTVELKDWVKKRYAAHAYPRHIHYLATLPRTPSGKIQRFILRRQLRDRSGD